MNKMIIYQLLPRLFGNETSDCHPDAPMSDNGVGKFSSFTPKALKAIRELGCTHVWFTGVIEHATQTDHTAYGIPLDNPYVVKGKAGSPYAIKDYYDVCPDFADEVPNRMTEFESLVERTHQQGLKVIIDFVPNHVARRYHSDAKPEGVTDFGANDDTKLMFSPMNNFYYFPGNELNPRFYVGEGNRRYVESPAKATGNDCFSPFPDARDWYETVKLNYGVDYLGDRMTYFNPIPNTWTKMEQILLFWASKGIDAFRCDMAEMVPCAFWGWVIPRVKSHYPSILFIAEVYNPNQYHNYTIAGKFDYLYDKVGLYDTLRDVMCGRQSASSITRCWQSLGDLQPRMLNFLENHDEQRIASDFFAGTPEKGRPALLVSALMSRSPFMLYFGQELGERGMDEEGFSGRDGRTSIFDYWTVDTIRRWNNGGKFNKLRLTLAERDLRDYYVKVLARIAPTPLFGEGLMYDVMYANYENQQFDGHSLYAFLRKTDDALALVIANFSNAPLPASVVLPAHAFEWLDLSPVDCAEWTDLLTNETTQQTLSPDAPISVVVPALSGVVLKTSLK